MVRADVDEGMIRFAKIFRRAGEQLKLKLGAGARELLDEALDEAEREIESYYAGQ